MEIIDLNKSTDSQYNEEVGVALGNFDGLHRGHIKLLKSMIEESKKRNLKSAVLLFKNHTKFLLNNGNKVKILTSNDDKIEILKNIGIDKIFLIDFNEELMKLSGYDFIKDILINKMNVKYVTIGFDYRFGYKASSTSKDMYNIGLDFNMETKIVDAIYVDEHLISSTLIRNLILEGRLKEANNYLGRYYKIKGKVVHGKKRGHKLGFPTANIDLIEPYPTPKTGVYYTKAIFNNKSYDSLTNIGYNPTFEDEELTIETYIDNFSENIYDKLIEIEFLEFIRDDIKFDSEKDLIKQMETDLKYIK